MDSRCMVPMSSSERSTVRRKLPRRWRLHGVGFEREWHRLGGEVQEDDQDRRDGRDCLRLADDDKDILVVAVDGDEGAGVEGGVAMTERAELAVPVEEGGRVGVFYCCVEWWWSPVLDAGLPFAGAGGASQVMSGVAASGVDGARTPSSWP